VATLLGKIVADFTTSLATAMAVGATSVTLQSATDDDNIALPAGHYFFAIDGDNAQKEHISCDLSGTSLTNIKSLSRQGVETSGCVRTHRVGSSVTLTDFAHIKYINDLIAGTTQLNSAVPLAYDGVADMTGNDNKLATVAYVKSVAIAGSPDATTATKGITKMSVAPVSPTSPIAVGDNDGRVPTQNENDALVGTSGTAVSSANKLVDAADVSNAAASGKIVRAVGTALPALDGSNLTGNPALNGANFTNIPPGAYVSGVTAALSTSSAANNDVTITTTFTPRLIRIKYWIQGHTFSSGTNQYTAAKGEAIYNGTTLISNNYAWELSSATDNTAPIGSSTALSFDTSPDSTSAPTAGDSGLANGGITVTLSIASVSSTTFVIRRLTAINGTNSNTARARISYEAFA
jgi:hypothetical protein